VPNGGHPSWIAVPAEPNKETARRHQRDASNFVLGCEMSPPNLKLVTLVDNRFRTLAAVFDLERTWLAEVGRVLVAACEGSEPWSLTRVSPSADRTNAESVSIDVAHEGRAQVSFITSNDPQLGTASALVECRHLVAVGKFLLFLCGSLDTWRCTEGRDAQYGH